MTERHIKFGGVGLMMMMSIVIAHKLTERTRLVHSCRLLRKVEKLLLLIWILQARSWILLVVVILVVLVVALLSVKTAMMIIRFTMIFTISIVVTRLLSITIISRISTTIRRSFVYNLLLLLRWRWLLLFVGGAGLSFLVRGSQVDSPSINLGLLHILNQVLRHCLILKSHKTKSSTRVRIGLLHDLDFFNEAVFWKKSW